MKKSQKLRDNSAKSGLDNTSQIKYLGQYGHKEIISTYIIMNNPTPLQKIALDNFAKNPPSSYGDLRMIAWLKLEKYFPDLDHRHQFITVALPNEYSLSTLNKNLRNISYSYLNNALARVENFSKSGENLHIHILKKGNYQKSKIIRDLTRTFKVAPNFVDVQSSKSPEKYFNTLAYIRGEKKDDDKMDNVKLDKQWRQDNEIPEIYYLNV